MVLNQGEENIHIIGAYAPDSNKSRESVENFYSTLQGEMDKIPHGEKLIIMGDLNARIGNTAIEWIMHEFNEEHSDDNGEKLLAFCTLNELRINNTFFDHKPQQKITWSNTRGQTSMIDFIITNRTVHPSQILDVRSLTSANVGSDHLLILGRFRLAIQRKKKPSPVFVEKLNIELMEDSIIKSLYRNRLRQKLDEEERIEEDDVETSWTKLKKHLKEAAKEVLGSRKTNRNATPQKNMWFKPEVGELVREKKEAYLRYQNTRSPEDHQEYKDRRNQTKSEIRRIKYEFWESFRVGMDHDLYGAQRKIWGVLRRSRREIDECTQIQKITKETWTNYFQQLYQ